MIFNAELPDLAGAAPGAAPAAWTPTGAAGAGPCAAVGGGATGVPHCKQNRTSSPTGEPHLVQNPAMKLPPHLITVSLTPETFRRAYIAPFTMHPNRVTPAGSLLG